jgi:hypothetical protein
MTIGVATLAPAAAQSADLAKAFLECVRVAAIGQLSDFPCQTENLHQPPSGIILNCEGQAAKGLFEALELVSSQEVQSHGISRKSDQGIVCFRVTGEPVVASCVVSVVVGGPFVDELRR